MRNVLDYFKQLNTPVQERAASWSVGDPALAEFLGLASVTNAGVAVNESSALGLTSLYRAVSLIASTIAFLPLKSYRTYEDDSRLRVSSFLDDPGGPDGLTAYEWKETILLHLLLHGNAYLLHDYNGAGGLHALVPVHPSAVSVKVEQNQKRYTITLDDGKSREFGPLDVTHVMGPSTDGVKGISPISACRNAIGTALAGEQAAGRMFANGMILGGLVSSDEALSIEQAEEIKIGLKNKLSGSQHAGDIAVVNASLKFSPWTMSAEDAEFIESRSFQVEEIARLYGVPRELLSASGATSWGSGISELVRAFQKFGLMPWTSRIEAKLSRLLAKPRYCEFEFGGLLQGSQAEVIDNMSKELAMGTMTIDEARAMLNRPPLPKSALPPKPPATEVSAEPRSIELRQEAMTFNIPAPIVTVNVPPAEPVIKVTTPKPQVNIQNDVLVDPGPREVTFQRDGGKVTGAKISG